jgi:biofilm PGA synthesis protein PgaD
MKSYDYSALIIRAPRLQTMGQRFSSSLVTIIFWALWLYLWQPIISIIAWGFGFQFFYENMISLGGIQGLLNVLTTYLIVLVVIAVVFFGWANYNRLRFKNKKRRDKTWKVSADNLGRIHKLTEIQVLQFKATRRLVVQFDQDGKIVDFSPRY